MSHFLSYSLTHIAGIWSSVVRLLLHPGGLPHTRGLGTASRTLLRDLGYFLHKDSTVSLEALAKMEADSSGPSIHSRPEAEGALPTLFIAKRAGLSERHRLLWSLAQN